MQARRIVCVAVLLLILPALSLPAGERIVVRCMDGGDCPDVTGKTLSPDQLARCQRVCDAIDQCPEAAGSCDLRCDQPCDESSADSMLEICLTRCVITTDPPRDLGNAGSPRIVVPLLAPLTIAEHELAAASARDASEFGRAVEHVPIRVHRIELAPTEGLGPRSPPRP